MSSLSKIIENDLQDFLKLMFPISLKLLKVNRNENLGNKFTIKTKGKTYQSRSQLTKLQSKTKFIRLV